MSRSHKAQCGLWVRPSKGLGSFERWRLGLRGSGSIGVAGAVTGRLDWMRCKNDKKPEECDQDELIDNMV